MTFASMAEAVAHFHRNGYESVPTEIKFTDDGYPRRVMARTEQDQLLSPLVEIFHKGFLLVEARFI